MKRDHQCLAETLRLAAQGDDAVHPDPLVGSVIVSRDDRITLVGRGFHARCGGPHAEPIALAEAGHRAVGATLYCNLEPCGYESMEKRQPACVNAIIKSGIERVVIGQIDPHPMVRGDGVLDLRRAGIHVDIWPDPMPFWLANPTYNTLLWLGRPFVPVDTPDGRPGEAWEAALRSASTVDRVTEAAHD